MDVVF